MEPDITNSNIQGSLESYARTEDLENALGETRMVADLLRDEVERRKYENSILSRRVVGLTEKISALEIEKNMLAMRHDETRLRLNIFIGGYFVTMLVCGIIVGVMA